MYFYLLINKDFIIIIQIVRVEFFHTRTELNNENKVILLTSCDFIHYTFGWFREGLWDKRQHFLFHSINYPSFSRVSCSVVTRTFTASHPKTGWRGFQWFVMGPKFSAWSGPAAWGVIGCSSLMRDLLFHHTWRVIFLWNFRDG